MECAECRSLLRQLGGYEARCEKLLREIEATLEHGNRQEMNSLKIGLTTNRMYADMTQIEIHRHRGLLHQDGGAISPSAVVGAGR